jgi:hypothetical protein
MRNIEGRKIMRIAAIVRVSVPKISQEDVTDILETFGISVSKSGFIGLPEDLDFFFSQNVFEDAALVSAFESAKQKWQDGDISYI